MITLQVKYEKDQVVFTVKIDLEAMAKVQLDPDTLQYFMSCDLSKSPVDQLAMLMEYSCLIENKVPDSEIQRLVKEIQVLRDILKAQVKAKIYSDRTAKDVDRSIFLDDLTVDKAIRGLGNLRYDLDIRASPLPKPKFKRPQTYTCKKCGRVQAANNYSCYGCSAPLI